MYSVTYGISTIPKTATARHVTITSYLWPAFVGEWIEQEQQFVVWELICSTTWKRREDIVSPPKTCIGIQTYSASIYESGSTVWYKQGDIWRKMEPH
jgi:hypothetical protein